MFLRAVNAGNSKGTRSVGNSQADCYELPAAPIAYKGRNTEVYLSILTCRWQVSIEYN